MRGGCYQVWGLSTGQTGGADLNQCHGGCQPAHSSGSVYRIKCGVEYSPSLIARGTGGPAGRVRSCAPPVSTRGATRAPRSLWCPKAVIAVLRSTGEWRWGKSDTTQLLPKAGQGVQVKRVVPTHHPGGERPAACCWGSYHVPEA
jgi:hypothetical protein